MTKLTLSSEVDVATLAQIFRSTTNSYKHLFFQAILSSVRQRGPVDCILNLDAVAVEMLALAWYPHRFFGLSFGSQDQVGRILERLVFSPRGKGIGNAVNQRRLRISIWRQAESIDVRSLLRYVPYRLLEPFFAAELRGVPDSKRNELVRELADDQFQERCPLYRFVNSRDGLAIELHAAWMAYLQGNYAIVEGWAERQWLAFLQRRNAATPALTEKIRPPSQRGPLSAQTRFWNDVLAEENVRCLYSGQALAPGGYALDHFVPWAFVCHDRQWNLVPVRPAANSTKGHALPDVGYLDELARIQAVALANFRQRSDVSARRFDTITEPYINDLGIDDRNLTDPDVLTKAYHSTVGPLLALARRSGFRSGWTYSG